MSKIRPHILRKVSDKPTRKALEQQDREAVVNPPLGRRPLPRVSRGGARGDEGDDRGGVVDNRGKPRVADIPREPIPNPNRGGGVLEPEEV